MKTLLFLTLGALLACPVLVNAQSTNDAPSGPPPEGGPGDHHHGMGFLTEAEKAELKKAHDAAVAANPSLETQMKSVMDQMKQAHDSGQKPSDDLIQQAKTAREQMDAAMIAADPAVKPILEKIKAHHHGHGPGGPGGPEGGQGGAGGTPPPADSGT